MGTLCKVRTLHWKNPNFKIKGTAYFAVGALLPGAVDVPKFSQIYIFDADDDN